MIQLKHISIIVLSLSLMILACAGAPWFSIDKNLKFGVIPSYRIQEILVELPETTSQSELAQTNENSQKNQTDINSQISSTETNENGEEENQDDDDYISGEDDEQENDGDDDDMIVKPAIDPDYDNGDGYEDDFGPFIDIDNDGGVDEWLQDSQMYTAKRKFDVSYDIPQIF